MKLLMNTLYVSTQGAYIRKDHQTLTVEVEKQVKLTVPVHHLEGIVCFGRVSVSHGVFQSCGEHGLSLSMLSRGGQFYARMTGETKGNVLLRREQYRIADDETRKLAIAKSMIAAKIQNSRTLLLRSARDSDDEKAAEGLRKTAARIGNQLNDLARVQTMDEARGMEGECARSYFDVLSNGIRANQESFTMNGRSRRPPKDRINAMLSFLYAVVRHDATSALEAVGLDPAVGFLHVERPGRPSLALDLMEEFRAPMADRIVLTLINRRQVLPNDFEIDPVGGVRMSDSARRTLLKAYQEKKREEVQHPLLKEATQFGLLPHIQARLLARVIRGDLPEYPALMLK